MKKKQTNYLEEAINRFIQELRCRGKKVQTLEPLDNGNQKLLSFQELKLRRKQWLKSFGKNLKRMTPSSELDL